jgi:hypothetical protein
VTRTQRRAVLAVVAVFVAAPFLLAGGLAVIRAIHSPWPEPVPGVRLEPRVPFLAPGDPVPTNDAFQILFAISNTISASSRGALRASDEWTRLHVGGLSAGPFSRLDRALADTAPAWPLWDAAARAPVGRVPEPDFDQIHPLGQSILLGWLTDLRAARAIESGDWAGATNAWNTSLSIGRHLRAYRTSTDHIVGVAIAKLTMRSMEQALATGQPPDAVLQHMEEMLVRHDGNRSPEADALRGELRMALGALRRVFEDPAFSVDVLDDPRATPPCHAWYRRMLVRLAGSGPRRTRKHIEAVYSRMIADSERAGTGDFEAWFKRFDAAPQQFVYDDPVGCMLLSMLIPSKRPLRQRLAEEDALLRGVRTLVAIERFRRANGGSAPESLGTLVPAWLPAVPADPFDPDGGPLRYVPGRAPWLLYSVGTNGVDDTARAPDGAPSTNDMHFGRAYLDQLRAFLTNTNAPKQ